MAGSCGRKCGLDLVLLWLWCRPAVAAPIQPLAWEPHMLWLWPEKAKKKKRERETEIFTFFFFLHFLVLLTLVDLQCCDDNACLRAECGLPGCAPWQPLSWVSP